MIKVGENGIFLSDVEARKLSPYMLEKLKKTLVISLQALQETPPAFVETDPIYSASSWFSTTNNASDWDTAYGWGNHASAGYALATSLAAVATSGSYSDLSGTPSIPTQVSQLVNDSGYITSSALSGYELLSNKSTSTSLGTSDSLYPTQNAVKQYVDTGLSGKQNTLGYTPEDVANKTTTITGNESSDTKYPTVKALYDWSTGLFATQSSLVGYVPTSRTITINGTTQDLSSNRSWTIAVPTKTSDLTNDSGFITSSALTGYIQNNVGISGGTTLIGDTASGGNLTLSSTSHATKGKILFGTSAYDEVNNSLGIGTTTPNWKLHVAGTVGADNIIAQFGDANKGVNIKTLANGTGLITSWSYEPTDPSAIAISAGANFGFNAAPNNFYGMGLGAARNGKYDMWFQTGTANGGGYRWYTGGTNERMTINKDGKVGIGTTTPTALLMLAAGTATAGTAPLKFTTGTNTTVAVAGQMEYNNTFHLTNSDATRRHVVTAPNTTKVTAAAPYTNDGYIIVNIGGIDFKLMTTA